MVEEWYYRKDALKIVTDRLAKRLRNDQDVFLVVDGYEGVGKSTLAMRLAMLIDPDFDADRMCMTGKDFRRAAAEAGPYACLVLDEAAEGGLSRDAMSEKNKAMIRFLSTCRKNNQAMILCFPNLHFLDPYLKDHRAKWWFHVERRGQALVHEPIRSAYTKKTSWKKLFRHPFGPAQGPVWDAYLKKKVAFVEGYDGSRGHVDPLAEERAQQKRLVHYLMQRSDLRRAAAQASARVTGR